MKSSTLKALILAGACTISGAQAQGELAALTGSSTTHAAASAPARLEQHQSAALQYLEGGIAALNARAYETAQADLQTALSLMRQRHVTGSQLAEARLDLADAYLGERQFEHAERIFHEALKDAQDAHNGALQLRTDIGLAETLIELGQYKQARTTGQAAWDNADRQHLNAIDRGRLALTLGRLDAKEALPAESETHLQEALRLFESAPRQDAHDIGLAEYQLALQQIRCGREEEANEHFDKAFAALDRESKFNLPLTVAPCAVSCWEPCSPRSRLIADSEYPLKYQIVGNLRVAAAVVRSENLIAVLVSLANCGRSRLQLAVGPVSLEQLQPKRREFAYVPSRQLDLPLEEEHVTSLTWRRRWLNHIEKTRLIPGYLNNSQLEIDNFFGNNTFGTYGDWPTIAVPQTAIVTREEFYYGHEHPRDVATINFLSQEHGGYRPTFLDPGEAKTGLVFFQQERYDNLKVRVIVGNTIVEIPFDSPGPRV